MPALTSGFLSGTIVIMIVMYVITFIYSIYMAIMNWRQSKVKDVLEETNELMNRNNELLLQILNKLK